MNQSSLLLETGAVVLYDGEAVRVVEVTGSEVAASIERTGRFVTVSIAQFAARCTAFGPEPDAAEEGPRFNVGTALARLRPQERKDVEATSR